MTEDKETEKVSQPSLFNDDRGAIFSKCRQYRYWLWRIWDDSKLKVMFVGLNPSTANETKNDHTISTVIRYAKSWGYGGVHMVNLFAYISTDPRKLLFNQHEKIGYYNNNYLHRASALSELIIFAWGSFQVNGRDKEVIKMFPRAHVLALNKDGSPHHPLRLSSDIKPKIFEYATEGKGL